MRKSREYSFILEYTLEMLHVRKQRQMIKRDVSTYLKISSRNLLHYCFLALTFTTQVPWYYPDSLYKSVWL